MTLKIFLTAILALIVLVCVFAVAGVIFSFIFEILAYGLLPFIVVRCLTYIGEMNGMSSGAAWTLSIIAGLWGMYPKVKQLFNNPQAFIREMRDRHDRVATSNNSYRSSNSDRDEDNPVAPEFRHRVCCGSFFWNKARESYYTNCDLHPDVGSASDSCSDWQPA